VPLKGFARLVIILEASESVIIHKEEIEERKKNEGIKKMKREKMKK